MADFLCQANHGAINSNNATYSTARSGSGFSVDTSATNTIGQSTGYNVWQGFLEFDTSTIPSGATITAATLKIKGAGDNSTTDFIINVYDKDYGASVTSADFIANGSESGLTKRCTYDTSAGWSSAAYQTFTDVALAAGITKAGTTRLVMMSSRQTGNNTPGGNEFVYWEATTAGSEATLTVTWTVPSGGTTRQSRDPLGMMGFFGG